MASYPTKLTDETIDIILSKLANSLKLRQEAFSLGLCLRLDIRNICQEADISHATYYRWLKAGRSLFRKRGLTDREQRLRAFARGVEKLMRKYAISNEKFVPSADIIPKLEALQRSVSTDTGRIVCSDKHEDLSKTIDQLLSEIEQFTDQLTGGVRCMEFKSKDLLKIL